MRSEGCSCSLEVLYRGLRISKLQFLIKKRLKKPFHLYSFLLQFLVIKALDIDTDPYPDSMNSDPQLWFPGSIFNSAHWGTSLLSKSDEIRWRGPLY